MLARMIRILTRLVRRSARSGVGGLRGIVHRIHAGCWRTVMVARIAWADAGKKLSNSLWMCVCGKWDKLVGVVFSRSTDCVNVFFRQGIRNRVRACRLLIEAVTGLNAWNLRIGIIGNVIVVGFMMILAFRIDILLHVFVVIFRDVSIIITLKGFG